MIDATAARILGNEHSQLYVGRAAVASDEEFFNRRMPIATGYPVRVFPLADGLWMRLAVPPLQPVSHGCAEVSRQGEDTPIAYLDLAIFDPAGTEQMWEGLRELQYEDEAFFLFFMFMQCLDRVFKSLGPAALIWGMQFRPSAGITGPEQAQVFKAFMDGLRAERGVGLSVMRQDNHSAPLLLMDIGAALRFGGTVYTPLTREELRDAGTPGQILISNCCWRAAQPCAGHEPAPGRVANACEDASA